jgi:hypothetical protein
MSVEQNMRLDQMPKLRVQYAQGRIELDPVFQEAIAQG